MSTTGVRTATEYEARLRDYYRDASEEGRAVRVGEKETSEQAAIVARYADLFTRGQLDVLRAEEGAAGDDERERLYRLAKTCEAGLVELELAEREDELTNAILAARLTFRGEEMPLRNAEARLAVEPGYRDRDELGGLERTAAGEFNPQRVELLRAREDLEAELSGEPDPVARSEEEKQVSLHELEAVLRAAADASADAYGRLRERWFERLLAPSATRRPRARTSAGSAVSRRSSRPTRRRRPSRSASRRCARSASTSRRSRTSSSTSRTARRRARAPA